MNFRDFPDKISKISGFPSDIKNITGIFSRELDLTPVAESGTDNEGDPYIVLENEKTFFGLKNSISDSALYHLLKRQDKRKIKKKCFRLFRDIIFRYNYPHMRPDITPDYPLDTRKKFFHPQHHDTIADIPALSDSDKQYLMNLYSPEEGDFVIDAGAFIGLGSLQMSENIGKTGKIIAVEPDKENFRILKKNIKNNYLDDIIHPVNCAVWDKRERLEFFRTRYQANSLISDIVPGSKRVITIEADSLDNIIGKFDFGMPDYVSLTINGAEPDAVRGMMKIIETSHPRLSIAGWYSRNEVRISEIIKPVLIRNNYDVLVGRSGRIYAYMNQNQTF